MTAQSLVPQFKPLSRLLVSGALPETDQTYSGQERGREGGYAGGGGGAWGGGGLMGNKGKKMSLPYRLSVRCPGLQKTSTVLLKCCFTSTETVGLLGTGDENGYLHFHTAPEL